MFNQVAKNIIEVLTSKGIQATVITNRDGSIYIDSDCDVLVRDALGMKRFRDYYNGVEVVIG